MRPYDQKAVVYDRIFLFFHNNAKNVNHNNDSRYNVKDLTVQMCR